MQQTVEQCPTIQMACNPIATVTVKVPAGSGVTDGKNICQMLVGSQTTVGEVIERLQTISQGKLGNFMLIHNAINRTKNPSLTMGDLGVKKDDIFFVAPLKKKSVGKPQVPTSLEGATKKTTITPMIVKIPTIKPPITYKGLTENAPIIVGNKYIQEGGMITINVVCKGTQNEPYIQPVVCRPQDTISAVIQELAAALNAQQCTDVHLTINGQDITTACASSVSDLGLKNMETVMAQIKPMLELPPQYPQNTNTLQDRAVNSAANSTLRPATTIVPQKNNNKLKWIKTTSKSGNFINVFEPQSANTITIDIFDMRERHHLLQPFVRLKCPASLVVSNVYQILHRAFGIDINKAHLFTNNNTQLKPTNTTPISNVMGLGRRLYINSATQQKSLPVTQTNTIPITARKIPQLYPTQQVITKSNPILVENEGFNITELRDELQKMTAYYLSQQAYSEKMRAKPQGNVAIIKPSQNQIIHNAQIYNALHKTPYNQYQTYQTTGLYRPQNAIYNLQLHNALNVNPGKKCNVMFIDDYGGKRNFVVDPRETLGQVIGKLLQENGPNSTENLRLYYDGKQIDKEQMQKKIENFGKDTMEIKASGVKINNKPINILNMGNNNPGYQNQINYAHPVNFPIYNQNNNQYVDRNLLTPKYVLAPPFEPKVNPRRIYHPKGKITIFYKTSDEKIEKRWDFDKDTKLTLGYLKGLIEEAGGNPDIIWFKKNRINTAFNSVPLGQIFISPKIYILGGVAKEKAIQQPNNINNLQFGNRLFNINPNYNQKQLKNKQSKRNLKKRNLKKIYTIDR